MVAAATRFFKVSSPRLDPRTGPDDTTLFDQEFVLLEDRAKHLYSSRFSTTTLANRIDVVNDLTPEIDPFGQGINLSREMSGQEIEPIAESPPYPPTLPTSSSPSSASSSAQLPSSQSKKRRAFTYDINASSIEARPSKRARFAILHFFSFLKLSLLDNV